VFVSPDLEPLVDRLVEELRRPLTDPMAEEVIVAPSADMANFLKRELGAKLGDPGQANGVLANVRFVYPRQLVNATIDEPIGVGDSPWDATRLTWTLAQIVATAPPTGLPRAFGRTPLAASRRTAELFDRYASHRPGMLTKWAQGHHYEVSQSPDKVWQVDLYKLASEAIGGTGRNCRVVTDPVEVQDLLAEAALPERISVFGVDSLSAAVRKVLNALAKRTKVDLYWVYPIVGKFPTCETGLERKSYVQTLVGHPLASRWATHAHESIAVMTDPKIGLPPVDRTKSILHRIQTGVLTDSWPQIPTLDEGSREIALKSGDGSIQVHACYGLSRQVEALRDSILHLLNDDPTLRLRDILVVCADVGSAAPLLNAIFDPEAPAGNGVPKLPINVLRDAENRLDEFSEAFFAILDLATGRCSASQLVDAAALGPVRSKFDLDDEAIDLLASWADLLGVRYGLNAVDRSSWNLDSSIANGTWDSAIERLMMGVAIPAEREIRGPANVVPFDGIATSELVLAGTLVEFLVRLKELVKTIREEPGVETRLSVAQWRDVLLSIVECFLQTSKGDEESLVRLRGSILRMVRDASKATDTDACYFTLRDLRLMTDEYFTTGVSDYWSVFESITVTGFGSMAHVPHRVIAFLGADEDAFASPRVDGDDVLSLEPRVGEPIYSLRGRQNLMDLLMATRSTFILSCTGSDVNSNKDVPFAVPVQELLEHIAAIVAETGGLEGNQRVLVRHPRHNFDPHSLTPGFVIDGTAFTFDENARLALEVLHRAKIEVASGDDEPIEQPSRSESEQSETRDAPAVPVREIGQLLDLLSNPIEYYYEEILNVSIPELPGDNEANKRNNTIKGDGILALTLDALEYSLEGRRLLEIIASLDDHDDDDWLDRVIAGWREVRPLTGLLPPGELGELVLGEISTELTSIIRSLPTELQTLQGVDVDCLVPFGGTPTTLRVRGVVQADGADTAEFARVRYARFAESMRLQLWSEVALLTIQLGGQLVTGHLSTRSADSKKSTPETDSIFIAGATNDARLANAQRACTAMDQLHSLASARPVAFFPSASRAIANGNDSAARDRLGKEIDRSSAVAWHLDGAGLRDLRKNRPARPSDVALLGDSHDDDIPSEIDLFAKFIWKVFDETAVSTRSSSTPETTDSTEEDDQNG